MAGAQQPITVETDDAEIRAAFARLVAAGGNLRGALVNIGEALVPIVRDHFDKGTSPDGVPWAPLSPRTLKQRARQKLGTKPLIAHGNLRNLIAYQVDDTGVTVGSNLVYAAIQQFGGDIVQEGGPRTLRFARHPVIRKDGTPGTRSRFARAGLHDEERTVQVGARTVTIPARPYLGVGPAERTAVEGVIADFLDAALGGQP